jgi:hypothetical protein
MSLNIATSSVDTSRLAVIARAALRLPTKPRPSRAAYMRIYRSERRAQELGTHVATYEVPSGSVSTIRKAALRDSTDRAVCPLCFETFETGAAYMHHFRERRFGSKELHLCLSRQEMRDTGTLVTNWETGAWKVRR